MKKNNLKVFLFPLGMVEYLGRLILLLYKSIVSLFTSIKQRRFPLKNTIAQMAEIGFHSLPIIFASSLFTGMVGVVQVGYQFEKFGAKPLIGGIIALTLAREVGPAMTAIILAGRIGSAYAAELGSMTVTEQIDALRSIATDPVEYLVLPRLIATCSMIIFLTLIFNFLGLMGGVIVANQLINLSPGSYFDSVIHHLQIFDIVGGLFKAFIFGAMVSIISCQEGFSTGGGAIGVGKATTRAVVQSILFILFSNLFLTIAIVNFQKSSLFEELSKILF
ncbi:MlaE family ABC transporter permease [Candidatus Riflebacteria bacterium]